MVFSISCTLPPFHIISVYILINNMCPGMCFTHQPLWHGITLTRPLRHLESYVGSKPIFTSSCWSINPISPLPSNPSFCSPYPIVSCLPSLLLPDTLESNCFTLSFIPSKDSRLYLMQDFYSYHF